eukprot:TRINITY_DN7625_c0_g1_i1.p2 TRINITY_DN7625_c0_g1~~TRINITY_DN7625_c0_g1_i1.p2  ORF type:complete len:147 (+),score=7.53 TRINITY_DN7625_c0_g1_i1:402-842(+)
MHSICLYNFLNSSHPLMLQHAHFVDLPQCHRVGDDFPKSYRYCLTCPVGDVVSDHIRFENLIPVAFPDEFCFLGTVTFSNGNRVLHQCGLCFCNRITHQLELGDHLCIHPTFPDRNPVAHRVSLKEPTTLFDGDRHSNFLRRPIPH